ncbi:hypothetical protein NZK35_11260 [Stieleria sp. ICT_E10.1]|uniref:hypothetical protein n=1 Tax=Stieleria sedimenti TaxID=2976331 RepID=UPI0021808422|nr:hypothetical protein [Stieleria sedimenti]MCS7467221.1 hypothetical protein [Stieleria sedimenti]
MIGHGCPPAFLNAHRSAAFVFGASVTLVVVWTVLVAESHAQTPTEAFTDTAIEASTGAAADSKTPSDVPASDPPDRQWSNLATRPFEFHSTNPAWPLVDADDKHQLSVKIRSLPQYADRELTLHYELIRVEDGAVVGREQTDLRLSPSGDCEEIAIAASSPDQPGVYEIRCRLSEKSDRIWSRLTRSPNQLASVQTPWMVFQDKTDDDVEPITWRRIGSIEPIDPSDWQRPAWMPNGATKLVPNVKRVSESLTLSTRRHAARDQPHELAPGQSMVGFLGELKPHQPYQLSLTLAESTLDAAPKTARIEFANTPEFQPVTRTVTLSVGRPMDVASDSLAAVVTHQILHFAHDGHEFVRISNESGDQSISIKSLLLDEPVSGESASDEHKTPRHVTLRVDSPNWLTDLNTDYTNQVARGDYAESTALMFYLWKATSRLATHAAWFGYDEASVAIDTRGWISAAGQAPPAQATADQPASAQAQSAPGPLWLGDYFEAAVAAWSASGPVRVIPRRPGRPNLDEAAHPGRLLHLETGAIDGQTSMKTSLRFLKSCVQSPTDVVSIPARELPLALERSFRETIHHYRQTPIDATPVSSSADVDSDYVHVLVNQTAPAPTSDQAPSPDQPSPIRLTVINKAPWTSQVKLQFSTRRIADCSLLRADDTNAIVQPTGVADTRLLTVAPTSIVRLQVRGETDPIQLVAWQGNMVGGAETLKRLKAHVAEVVGKIGTLALPDDYIELTNGGFEIEGQVGIVGWMHTQFPAGAVTLDSTESIEGSHSIRMTADTASAGRIWLVSEPIPVPRSGRLAVSFAIRANKKTVEADPNASPILKTSATTASHKEAPRHRVRVSLEGNRLGKPVRISTEFDVPCDGHWQPRHVVLEAERIHREEMESVRLTIDSLSPGKIWIDDVHLHDRFPTGAERTALQDNAFLAIQGLQRGNLKPAVGLLNNGWSRYLMARSHQRGTPPSDAATGNSSPASGVVHHSGSIPTPTAGRADTMAEPHPKRESVADRLRDWLPKPIRF